jgi:hypothetical protein
VYICEVERHYPLVGVQGSELTQLMILHDEEKNSFTLYLGNAIGGISTKAVFPSNR